jgi:hypothetical protein
LKKLNSLIAKLIILTAALIGLPLLGVWLHTGHIDQYLEFPPRTRYVEHEPFSWYAFGLIALLEIIVIAALIYILLRAYYSTPGEREGIKGPGFPWWGYLPIFTGAIFWALAWTRFDWFSRFQPHTFFPLWLSYIVFVNALKYGRTGSCALVNGTKRFLLLFPASAIFWWYFEYLNRFVQNWHYIGAHYGPLMYFILATLSFSTVLPAVLGTTDLLLSYSWIRRGLGYYKRGLTAIPKYPGWILFVMAGAALLFIGVRPNYLFPLVWVAPLLVMVSLQMIKGEENIVTDILGGRWAIAVSAALSALLCGFLWEMWNFYSLAKWEYSIPFVEKFHIFEMPLLGYGGYLPFGLECLVIASILGVVEKPMKI